MLGSIGYPARIITPALLMREPAKGENEQPQGRTLRYRRFNLEIFAYTGEQIPLTPSMNRPKGRGINRIRLRLKNNPGASSWVVFFILKATLN
ncbi:MAG: hypothetical protein LBH43_16465 [Treponema sp.]|jgi:hypothetical protein|nr:hypothetical protein [Treponema sp.]